MPRYTFHVLTSAAARKGSFGRYGHVAVLRVDTQERGEGYVPKQIRELRGVEIVWVRRCLNIGGPRSAHALALVEAMEDATARREAEEARCAREMADRLERTDLH